MRYMCGGKGVVSSFLTICILVPCSGRGTVTKHEQHYSSQLSSVDHCGHCIIVSLCHCNLGPNADPIVYIVLDRTMQRILSQVLARVLIYRG